MIQTVCVRPADTGDIDALVDLSKRTIRVRYTSFLGEKVVADYIASGAIEMYFQENLPRCFVIEDDGAVAGVGSYKDLKVDLMMIDVERQGRGLGTRLLQSLENLLFAKTDEPTLESFAYNERANTFYGNRGWKAVEHYDDRDTAIPMIRMRKRKI